MVVQGKQEKDGSATLPRIALPVIPRASKEEIERRRKLFAETIALREAIGPISVSVAEIIRRGRDEVEGD